MTTIRNIILGFIAGAIATLTAHEIIKYFLHDAGYIPMVAWSMLPVEPYALPKLVSDSLWGGMWGSIFALILGSAPTGSMTFRGALLGMIGPAFLGVFVIVPLIKGIPLFMDGNNVLIGSVLAIAAGFGAVTAWLYGFFTSGCRLP